MTRDGSIVYQYNVNTTREFPLQSRLGVILLVLLLLLTVLEAAPEPGPVPPGDVVLLPGLGEAVGVVNPPLAVVSSLVAGVGVRPPQYRRGWSDVPVSLQRTPYQPPAPA